MCTYLESYLAIGVHILYLESFLAIGVHIFGKLPCYRSQVCTYLENYLALGVHILYLESYIAIGVHIFGKLPCYRSQVCTYLESYLAIGVHIFGKLPVLFLFFPSDLSLFYSHCFSIFLFLHCLLPFLSLPFPFLFLDNRISGLPYPVAGRISDISKGRIFGASLIIRKHAARIYFH